MVSLLSQKSHKHNIHNKQEKGQTTEKSKTHKLTADEIQSKAAKMCEDFLNNNASKIQSLNVFEKPYMNIPVFSGCIMYMYNTGLILMAHGKVAYVVLVDEKYIDTYTSLSGFKINGEKFILTIFNKIIIYGKDGKQICIVDELLVKKYITEYFIENITASNYSYVYLTQQHDYEQKEIQYVNKQDMFNTIVVCSQKLHNRFEKLHAILYNHEK